VILCERRSFVCASPQLQSLKRGLLLMLLVICPGLAFAQNPNPQVSNRNQFPTITFASSRFNANPPYYSIAVDSTGSATYQSISNSVSQSGLPYSVEFSASNATRSKVFQIAEALNFFRGNSNDEGGGTRADSNTLTFSEGRTRSQITYYMSSNPLIQSLTSLFEEISATLEFGRRLSATGPGNSAGTEAELERMTQMIQEKRLIELQAVAPVLQQISSNPAVSQRCRQQARFILGIAKGSAPNQP
jgi:superfamily I DNA/RNA helicase